MEAFNGDCAWRRPGPLTYWCHRRAASGQRSAPATVRSQPSHHLRTSDGHPTDLRRPSHRPETATPPTGDGHPTDRRRPPHRPQTAIPPTSDGHQTDRFPVTVTAVCRRSLRLPPLAVGQSHTASHQLPAPEQTPGRYDSRTNTRPLSAQATRKLLPASQQPLLGHHHTSSAVSLHAGPAATARPTPTADTGAACTDLHSRRALL